MARYITFIMKKAHERIPKGSYLTIDTQQQPYENEFGLFIKEGEKVILRKTKKRPIAIGRVILIREPRDYYPKKPD